MSKYPTDNFKKHTLQIEIPSNLTKAEAEEALKNAIEGKRHCGWYKVVLNSNRQVMAMYLNQWKQWEHISTDGQVTMRHFEYADIISPMIVKKEQD